MCDRSSDVIVVCAWCQAQGQPALLGVAEPIEDPRETHGICERHHRELLSELRPEVHVTAA
jgi:hypothetical protein